MAEPGNLSGPPLMSLLPAPLARRLQGAGRPKRYGDGALIHARGDDRPGISIVREGAVRIGAVGADGAFLTVSVLGPGQCFGEFTLFMGLPRTHDAIAVGETIVDQVSGPAFRRLFDAEPDLARALLQTALVRSHLLLEILDDLRRLPLPVRLAKLLVSLGQPKGDGADVSRRQEEIASSLGVSRVSVGKALQRLRADALIETGYGFIYIPDTEKMRRWIAKHSPIAAIS